MNKNALLICATFVAFPSISVAVGACPGPGPIPLDQDATPARLKQAEYAFVKRTLLSAAPDDVLVYGQFERIGDAPFLHDLELAARREKFVPRSDIAMPWGIEYSYSDQFRFTGHAIEAGQLVPFETTRLVIKLQTIQELEGSMSMLPPTNEMVVGVLAEVNHQAKLLQIESSYCPSYYRMNAEEIDGFLACFNDPACD